MVAAMRARASRVREHLPVSRHQGFGGGADGGGKGAGLVRLLVEMHRGDLAGGSHRARLEVAHLVAHAQALVATSSTPERISITSPANSSAGR